MSTNDVTKLPKWAQADIERLSSAVEYHKARLRESIARGEDASDTLVYMGYGEEHVGLPKGTPIRFQTDTGQIQVRAEGDHVEITSHHGSLALFPHVTNEIKVKVVRR